MADPHPPLELRTRTVGPWPMNTYALVCPVTCQSVLIDPGAETDTLRWMLADTDPVAILLTHTHQDHIGALAEMCAMLDVPLMAYAGSHVGGPTVEVDRTLAHGDTIAIGKCSLRVYHTPGHADDMLSFYLENDNRVIVGDTIFQGGPGRTWSHEGFLTTLRTLRTIVLSWSDETICYPGHGPSFRLGDERPAIEAFLQRDHGTFFGDASWDM